MVMAATVEGLQIWARGLSCDAASVGRQGSIIVVGRGVLSARE